MSYSPNQTTPTYEAGYAHSEPLEPEYNNGTGNSNNATAYQYETYAMCNRCYTQQDCPHRHTTYQQQHGLNTGGHHGMMMLAPTIVTGYPRHDPPLSSVGVALSNNGYNNVNRSQQGGSQQPVSSPWYNNGVNNEVVRVSNMAVNTHTAEIQQQQQQQQQQNLPYFSQYTGLGLDTMTMAASEEDLFPHGLPDLQRSATVAPSALERYRADDHTTTTLLQAEQPPANQSQRHTTTTTTTPSLATPASSASSASSPFVSSSSTPFGPMMLRTQKPKPPQITSEATYHRALYGHGPETPGDPSCDRAVANRQVLPTIAAQHGHPVWPLDTKAKKNTYLLEGKKRGLSYRKIKEFGEISDAESTLRGRYRMLTKTADERVRRPVWEEKDLQLLHQGVKLHTDGRQRRRRESSRRTSIASMSGYSSEDRNAGTEPRISWKGVAEYITQNGGSYKFGYATCKRKWEELNSPDDS
ncbi:uncharacterized protein TRUGW13939_01153 [Talaromyces rugulosus]|uniref:Myb-like domain-containing protein n=1 Tax=Talaromyces rugulosus TaxID=121627 RepID=A0A7H8QJF1_TALRU|nr:uncharacterized protein TRUGW13939_01153 [Talaromyces rugulosus]QKX54070.1 hypothetical protein TRUGW13939_01153 [Talaromyces rugulosus]